MDIFRTSEPSLLQNVNADEGLNKSIQEVGDIGRSGNRITARDMLDLQLGVYKSIGPIKSEQKEDYSDPHRQLEDTHGESFHTDNCKHVEKHQSTVEDVSEQKKRKELVDESRKPGRTQKTPRFMIEKENDESISIMSRSMSEEKLFMKAMGWMNDLEKAETVTMPKKELIDEHEKLVNTLESPSRKDDKKEAKKQKKELEEYKEKSELDDLVDLIKGCGGKKKEKSNLKPAPTIQAPPRQNPTMKKSFIRAQGPGGMTFDFGDRTGNPIADNFTDALRAFPEPQQESIYRSQNQEYARAVDEFVTSGERNFHLKHSGTTSDGSIHPDAQKSLEGSFDQQTANAISKGQVRVQEGFVPKANAGELNTGDGPAVINQYNDTQITMGGQVIKATSETDQALIEVMRRSFPDGDMGGDMIDTSMALGRNVMIDACSGEVIE